MGFQKGNKIARANKGKAGIGRPKEETREALRDLMTNNGMRAAAIATLHEALANRDKDGNVTNAAAKAAEHILIRTDGPPDQQVQHTGKVQIVVTYED